VDVFLYDDNKSAFKCEPELNNHNCPLLILEEDIKIEELDLSEVASTSTEHDYCSGAKNKTNEKPTNDRSIFDHPYCRPASYESLPKVKREKVEQDESNKLIYGLDSYLRESKGGGGGRQKKQNDNHCEHFQSFGAAQPKGHQIQQYENHRLGEKNRRLHPDQLEQADIC
jgi:hypothetical protein